jgi:hypothetical protein
MTAKTDTPSALNLDALAESVAAQEQGREIDILDGDGKPIGLKIVVAGVDSERYRIAWRAEIRSLAEEGALDAPDPLRDEAGKRRIAAACVIAWAPDIELGGKTLRASRENAETVFKAVPTIFDQVYAAVLYRAGFTKR